MSMPWKNALAACILFIVALYDPGSALPAGSRMKKHVADQREMNRRNHDAVLAQVRGYMDEINGRIGTRGGPRLALPLDENTIEDMTSGDHFHTGLRVPEPVIGYINGRNVNMRTEAGKDSEIIGKPAFNEEVEIIGVTETTDTIDGATDNWVLVRRLDKTEGWIFGRYLQNVPAREGAPPARKDETSRSHFHMPVDGIITSPFGHRVHPITKKRGVFHSGIDIGAPEGTPVKAAAGGVVRLSAFKKNGYGNLVIIDHGDGLCTYYGHLSRRNVHEGDTVDAGIVIGLVGSTGQSTGPHLHFEVRRGDTALNPDSFLR